MEIWVDGRMDGKCTYCMVNEGFEVQDWGLLLVE